MNYEGTLFQSRLSVIVIPDLIREPDEYTLKSPTLQIANVAAYNWFPCQARDDVMCECLNWKRTYSLFIAHYALCIVHCSLCIMNCALCIMNCAL